MKDIEPLEFPWCEGCGWSLPFCTCPDESKFEEEEEGQQYCCEDCQTKDRKIDEAEARADEKRDA